MKKRKNNIWNHLTAKEKSKLPYNYKFINIQFNSENKPVTSLTGRSYSRIQNENFLMKGNGLRIPISKFKL